MNLRSPIAAILGQGYVEQAASLQETGCWFVAALLVIPAGRRWLCE